MLVKVDKHSGYSHAPSTINPNSKPVLTFLDCDPGKKTSPTPPSSSTYPAPTKAYLQPFLLLLLLLLLFPS